MSEGSVPHSLHIRPHNRGCAEEGSEKSEQSACNPSKGLVQSVTGLSGAPSFIHSSNTYKYCCIPGTVLGLWKIPNPIFHPLQNLQSASKGTRDLSVGERDEAWGVRKLQAHRRRG